MSRFTRATTATAIGAAVLMVPSIPTAVAGGSGEKNGRYGAGAPGIGDAYFPLAGNGGYDVRSYDIRGSYDPATDVFAATTKIKATATQNLYRFNLDLVGMEISRLVVNDKRAKWTRTATELVVTPQRKLKKGQPITITATYAGVPHEFVLPFPGFELRTGFMATDDGANVAGQPDVAAGWFPVNDHPLDKATYRFQISVPEDLGVVANGHLKSRTTVGGRATYTWKATEPMASYLATIDIGDWDVRTWTTADGLPVYDAVDPDLLADPELGPAINSSLARQGEVVDVLEDAFGPYPFDTVGAIVDDQDDLFFALETQTRPVYSKYFWPDGGDGVVVHELAHQWFGDDVALARWQDIWLNEGPATYAEWLWAEHEGQATPQEIFEASYADIPADDPFWQVVIGQPPADNLFDGAVYLRGAMTMQVLRNEVGDADFFEIVRTWAADHSGGHGTTPQFIALAEQISGEQLDQLFDTWLFTAGKPASIAAGLAKQKTASATEHSWREVVADRLGHGRY